MKGNTLNIGEFINKVTTPIGEDKIEDYQLSGIMCNIYNRFKLEMLGIKRAKYGNLYSLVDYCLPKKLKCAPDEY
ncbi:hypothetical protein LCGC14_2922580 [marine sediment metagenome]|uniref:Uncharacterized protein n=1 Tax=marine sediment metagenome TaxID=412755 RepID=A0A0F8XNN6_9ZZZZ